MNINNKITKNIHTYLYLFICNLARVLFLFSLYLSKILGTQGIRKNMFQGVLILTAEGTWFHFKFNPFFKKLKKLVCLTFGETSHFINLECALLIRMVTKHLDCWMDVLNNTIAVAHR